MRYTLSLWDAYAFVLVLLISMGVGVWHAVVGRTDSNRDFILGSKNMPMLPSVLSMIGSFVSGIALLSYPAEVYLYGTAFCWHTLGAVLALLLVGLFLVPAIYKVQSVSVYRYFIDRFDSKALTLYASIQFTGAGFFYASISLYAPAVSLAAVTDIPLWTLIIAVGLLCTVYTSIGGIKTVVWTDAFQMAVMFLGCVAVWIRGGAATGGLAAAWKTAENGRRLDGFGNFDPDPFQRMTALTAIIGGLFYWATAFGGSQVALQRYCCMSTVRRAQALAWYVIPFFVVVQVLVFGLGVIMYAYYVDCDPLQERVVRNSDQLVVYFVTELFHDIPGMPGVFVASVLSGSLSTLSSMINSLSAVTWSEFVQPFFSRPPKERTVTLITKFIVVCYGIAVTAMAFNAESLGGILNALVSGLGAINGPKLGLFLLGVAVPSANGPGAVSGVILGTVASMWMFIGARIYPVPVAKLPLSVQNCAASNGSLTTVLSSVETTTRRRAESSQRIIHLIFTQCPSSTWPHSGVSSLSLSES
uniref:Sodium-coupled monocarboxylate transporter 1 n=1 Tax=Plectus sambesii TaxID=2011161 RepID=A0A914WNV2_9BILA